MIKRTYFILSVLLAMALLTTACGQIIVGFETGTPEAGVPQVQQTELSPPTTPSTETPTPAPSPTSEWTQYWTEVLDPYHNIRFAVPCFWLVNLPAEDPAGSGAFSYAVKNFTDEYVFNFPRSAIPPEAGAIKIDMAFLSAADMRGLPPGTSQLDFVNALYGDDPEVSLISTEAVEINGQSALMVTTENNFGISSFPLFTVTDDLFLIFGVSNDLEDHPDVQGILNSIALSPEVSVQMPEHKPAPPPVGLAAPCIPGYEQAVVPTVDIPESNTACGLSSFVELNYLVESVQDKLVERNYGSLRYDYFINDPFVIGYWGSESSTLAPEEVFTVMANNLLPPTDATMTFTTDRAQFPPLAGMPPENMFGPNVKVAQVVYSEGWGADGRAAALLYFAQDQCAGYYWHGLVYSQGYFDK
ncbi:MAG: hypothetical protein JSV61_06355 [Anaerolineales bacterium]|nr:MAG: hypothetical protein JSV61_06355 [Anaerolineales bacterium]